MNNSYAANDKNYQKQCAETYMLYMMIGSYFSKTYCSNSLAEKRLYLYYKELPANRQTAEEERISRRFEKKYHDYLKQLENLHCEVHFSQKADKYIIYFRTGFDEIKVTVYPNSQYKTELYLYH